MALNAHDLVDVHLPTPAQNNGFSKRIKPFGAPVAWGFKILDYSTKIKNWIIALASKLGCRKGYGYLFLHRTGQVL